MIPFLVVLLHEGAHIVVAKKLGYAVENIELFPFGGVARVKEFISINPQHEMAIAVAGPIINFILVIVLYPLSNTLHFSNQYITFFIYSNLIIGIFNLMPIVPLDGGRIVRGYLSYFMGLKKATKMVVMASKIVTILLFLVGIYTVQYNQLNLLIPLLAIFLYIAADKENKMAAFIFMKEIAEKKQYLFSKRILPMKSLVALDHVSVKEMINQFTPRKYHVITVMDRRCNIIGLLTESEVLDGMIKYGTEVSLEKLLKER